jgi:hypothetical protein
MVCVVAERCGEGCLEDGFGEDGTADEACLGMEGVGVDLPEGRRVGDNGVAAPLRGVLV